MIFVKWQYSGSKLMEHLKKISQNYKWVRLKLIFHKKMSMKVFSSITKLYYKKGCL